MGRGKPLKHILSHLYCAKYNEINSFRSDVQNHASSTESHKRFQMCYGLCLETAVFVF